VSVSIDELQSWTGRTETRVERLSTMPIAALAATLDRADPQPRDGDPVPPLWHWLYFLPLAPQAQLGEDGHPRRGGFLPPVPLPRRMWAGGRLTFHQPLHVGETVTRESRIESVDSKQGRTGALVFVKVLHELRGARGLAITEQQDLVYREPATGADGARARLAPALSTWRRRIEPSETLLFRYSALTFNSHRIHYDRPYATSVEGYPALVVHGPLIATLLIDLLRRSVPGVAVASFAFRAVAPLFDSAAFDVCGERREGADAVELWAMRGNGELAMEATATLQDAYADAERPGRGPPQDVE